MTKQSEIKYFFLKDKVMSMKNSIKMVWGKDKTCISAMLSYAKIHVLFLLVLATANAKNLRDDNTVRKFPDGFLFGTATASYQVEGAWDEDGKAENIWDHITHTQPCIIADCKNGDIADDSYHNVERDVEMMRELGLDFYRFSLSWTRILPTSFPDKINQAGVDYYNRLINEMLKYNIEPMVTLYHWDLPQKLQEMGGWTNPNIVDWFADYARVAYELFGDRVKYWITFNEPKEICHHGYSSGLLAPMYQIPGFAEYLCAKNLLVSHANAWHLYNDDFKSTQNGINGIALSIYWAEPDSDSKDDIEAASDYNIFEWGLYMHPIFSATGNWHQVIIDRIAEKSTDQGYPRSRLPAFTVEEIEYVKGTSDFLGVNHYSSTLVYRNGTTAAIYEAPSYYNDIDAFDYKPEIWEHGVNPWLAVVPWGFYKVLTQIREEYNNPPIYITENGFSTSGGLEDDERVNYYRTYLDAMLDAIDEGSDVRGYAAWSLMDNFEWHKGYTELFGLYEVDYESPERTRTPRRSAFVYKEIIRTKTLDFAYVPDTIVMTIDPGH